MSLVDQMREDRDTYWACATEAVDAVVGSEEVDNE
jgi:hypothetical protein